MVKIRFFSCLIVLILVSACAKNHEEPKKYLDPANLPQSEPESLPDEVSTTRPILVHPTYGIAKAKELQSKLKYFLVDSYRLNENLSENLKLEAQLVGEEWLSCGILSSGSVCDPNRGASEVALYENENGELKFYSENSGFTASVPRALIWSIEIKTLHSEESAHQYIVQLLQFRRPRLTELKPSDFLENEDNFQVLFTAILMRPTVERALQRFQMVRDVREMYLMTQFILQANPKIEKQLLQTAIWKNRLYLLHTPFATEQELMVLQIIEEQLLSPLEILELCESLINVKSERVRVMAAALLLRQNPKRLDLQDEVIRALRHHSISIRKIALDSLWRSKLDKKVEMALLALMLDKDVDIRRINYESLMQIKIKDSWLRDLDLYLSTPAAEIRLQLVQIIGRSSSHKAKTSLLRLLDDQDGDVRQKIYELLIQRTFYRNDLKDVIRHFSSNMWQTRRAAAFILGKIKSAKSRSALEQQLQGETDLEVRTQIAQSLRKISP
jgi:hypothetical protein